MKDLHRECTYCILTQEYTATQKSEYFRPNKDKPIYTHLKDQTNLQAVKK